MRSGLRVALVHDLKDDVAVAPDAPSDALAEYDSIETVQALKDVQLAGGHQGICLEGDETLPDHVGQTAPDICLNIAKGLRGDAREDAGDLWTRLFQGWHANSRCLTVLPLRMGL